MITLGYKVRAARLALGLSKRELGLECGVTEWAIRDIEARGSEPRMSVLRNLRRVFGLTYDELIGDSDFMTREELHDAIALVNSAIGAGQKTAKADLTELIERLHDLDRIDTDEGRAPRGRRQLQLPDTAARGAGARRR